jgi:uncharacterized protein (TIGR03067 family)
MRRAVLSALLIVAASSAVAAPAPVAKAERRTDLAMMQGAWEVLSERRYWQQWISSPCTATVRVTSDRFLWHRKGRIEREEVIRLDKGNIDLTDVETGRTCRGIYRLTGDTLTLHTPEAEKPRSKSFDDASKGATRLVLRRVR